MKSASYRPCPLMDIDLENAGGAPKHSPGVHEGETEDSLLDKLPPIVYARNTRDATDREAAKGEARWRAVMRLKYGVFPDYLARASKALGPQASAEDLLRHMFLTSMLEHHSALQISGKKEKPLTLDLERRREDEKILVELAHYAHTHGLGVEKAYAEMRYLPTTQHRIGETKLKKVKSRNASLWKRLKADRVYTRYLYEILLNGLDLPEAANLALSS